MTERPFDKSAAFIIQSIADNPDYARQYEEVTQRLEKERAEGKIEFNLTCEEARRDWIIMARRRYVGNIQEMRWPNDVQLGYHMASCSQDPCQNLFQVYLGILRPSSPEDSPRIAEIVNSLERSMFG